MSEKQDSPYSDSAFLSEADVDPSPIRQFEQWYANVRRPDVEVSTAMTFVTASRNARPAGRVVLLKSFNERGFVFYTNYGSDKGKQIEENPWGALVFWWPEYGRQVRIEGRLEKVSDRESDSYFQSRPRAAQITAWVSRQSHVVRNRAVLEERKKALETEYEGRDIPRPPFWGGYRLVPVLFEFWQGCPDRLHDRLCYRLHEDGTWHLQRLSP